MRIERFGCANLRTGWTLEETSFERLNLLVGLSGAGKTNLLRSLVVAQHTALGIDALDGHDFRLVVSHEGHRYDWSVRSLIREWDGESLSPIAIQSERLERDDGEVVFERHGDQVSLRKHSVPPLARDRSLFALLEDDELSLLASGFGSMLTSEAHTQTEPLSRGVRMGFNAGRTARRVRDLEKLLAGLSDLATIRASSLPLEVRALALKHVDRDAFANLVGTFQDMFPSVEEVDIRPLPDRAAAGLGILGEALFGFAILERGSSEWIYWDDISSGMLRVLMHLFEIRLALPGSIILVDEVENSLGVNCLAPLVDFFLDSPEHQFVLTSHHPYIINNLPIESWKLVRRVGSRVTVTAASEIPALRSASKLDRFTRLMNLPELAQPAA